MTRSVSTTKIVHQRNSVTVWIGAASIHVLLIRAANTLNVHQPIMRLSADARTVSPETHILNVIRFKVVEVIRNVAIMRPVWMADVRRHVNAEVLHCARCIITMLPVNVPVDIRAMHASAVVHHRIHVNRIRVARMPCVNLTVATRFASVPKDWPEIHSRIAVCIFVNQLI